MKDEGAREVPSHLTYEEALISELAERECQRLCRKVIRKLTRITSGGLSGEDSGLRNVWDEICVQVQGSESIDWEEYLDIIVQETEREVEKLGHIERVAIWLQTEAGIEWTIEDEQERSERIRRGDSDVGDSDEVTSHLVQEVLNAAANWSSKRVEAYLESRAN